MSEEHRPKCMLVFETERTVQVFLDNQLVMHVSKRLSTYQSVVDETLARAAHDDL